MNRVKLEMTLEEAVAIVNLLGSVPAAPVADPDGPTRPFDPVAAAQWVWDRKVALDAGI
jgi:hypothetical protein